MTSRMQKRINTLENIGVFNEALSLIRDGGFLLIGLGVVLLIVRGFDEGMSGFIAMLVLGLLAFLFAFLMKRSIKKKAAINNQSQEIVEYEIYAK